MRRIVARDATVQVKPAVARQRSTCIPHYEVFTDEAERGPYVFEDPATQWCGLC